MHNQTEKIINGTMQHMVVGQGNSNTFKPSFSTDINWFPLTQFNIMVDDQ